MFKRTLKNWEDQGNDRPSKQNILAGLKYNPEVSEHKEVMVDPRVDYQVELLR